MPLKVLANAAIGSGSVEILRTSQLELGELLWFSGSNWPYTVSKVETC